MDQFEALYMRRCRSTIGWFEVGEFALIGLKVVYESTMKVRLIWDHEINLQFEFLRIKASKVTRPSFGVVPKGVVMKVVFT